ncbi:MAG: ABC-F family ATP-binding cassette domain-containing protein [Bacteroidota bacterium]
MLGISELSYFIGDRPIYDKASLHIKDKDKIGLIGLNGTGKSTLLRIINGDITNYTGEVSKAKDCTIGFLNQDLLSYESEESILNVALMAFSDVIDLQHQIDDIIKKLETDYSDGLVEKLTKLQERFEAHEGYTLQSKAEEILEGIGFKTDDLNRPLKEFSGGWRMRVMLAKLLLEKPSLLMLDEPTNHLDLPSIKWIENYLKSYEGAVIVVSHDRYFLNRTIETIVEVSNASLNLYPGNYTFYLQEKELRAEIQNNAYENQQQKIKQTERFVERFRAKASKARQVQSKVKMLDKLDKIERVEDEVGEINFKFSFNQKSGKLVSELNDVEKSYGSAEILKNSNAYINRGDKIALIGANGKGKSTLLRIVAGTEPHQGDRKLGHNVLMGFYAQHQLEALNVNNDLLEELKQSGSGKTELELRGILGSFLFTGEQVFKRIKVLSGGEKSRVALAKTLISESNFLLLDEPTNHLDIQSVEILIQALNQYEGTYLVVSHDRHFVTKVANKIWYIEDRELKEYPGTYEEYELFMSERQPNGNTQKEVKKEKPKSEKKPKDKSEEIEIQNKLRNLKKELSEIEQHIQKLEDKETKLESDMSNPEVYGNPDKLLETNQKYEKIKAELESVQEDWDKKAEEIDELEGELI